MPLYIVAPSVSQGVSLKMPRYSSARRSRGLFCRVLIPSCHSLKFVLNLKEIYRGVAQPGSAPALGAGGRRFKSSRPDKTTFLKFP